MFKTRILFLSVIFLAFCVTVISCNPANLSFSVGQKSESDEVFELVDEVYRALDVSYVDPEKIDPEKLSRAAVQGIVDFVQDARLESVILDSLNECQEEAVPETSLSCIVTAYETLQDNHSNPNELIPSEISIAAVNGMVASLEDRYTAYIPIKEFQIYTESLRGNFEGIGAHVQEDQDSPYFIIIAPIIDSPAEKAGIRSGDTVLAVNGNDVKGMTIQEFISIVRGPKGEVVVLTVQREGETDTEDISIVRDVINSPSVTAQILEGEQYGYLRILSFTEKTTEETLDAMEELIDEGAKGVVIDLRNNPGGLLNTTVNTTSLFLENDLLVTYELDNERNRREWNTSSRDPFTNIPLVVLLNEFSASGSEVFSSALQDHNRATLIGDTTFGKGSVTLVHRLRDGSGLNITSARWYSPSDRLIEGKGITPDIFVELIEEPEMIDEQLNAAIEELNRLAG